MTLVYQCTVSVIIPRYNVFGRILVTLTLALNKVNARNTRPRPRPKASRPRPRPENLASRPRPNNPGIELSSSFSSFVAILHTCYPHAEFGRSSLNAAIVIKEICMKKM